MSLLTGRNTVITRELEGLDRPPAIPNAMDDEFNGSSLDAKWTWLDQGGAVAVVSKGRLEIAITETANRIRGIYQAAPAGAWTVEAKVWRPMANSGITGVHSALFCGKNITENQHGLAWWQSSNHFALTWATPASGGTAWLSNTVSMLQRVYYRMAWDGVNTATVSVSKDGVEWWSQGAVLAYVPTLVGLGFSNATGDRTVHVFEWFRRVA